MEAFATACAIYADYEETKKRIEASRSELTAAINANPDANVTDLRNSITAMEDANEEKAKSIRESLETAASSKIEGPKSFSIMDGAVSMGSGSSGSLVNKQLDGSEATYLSFDENAIFNQLGHQGSAQCGVYSMAYGWTILEGKSRIKGNASHQQVANAYNSGAFCMSQWNNMNSFKCSSSKDRMNKIWDEVISKKKPCVVAVGSNTSENHYVLVTGVRAGARSGKNILHYYDGGNFNGSGYGLQMVTFNTKKA